MVKKKTDNIKFNKEQLIKSNKYINNIDLLNSLLKDEMEYTIEDVDNIIKGFLESEVR